MMTWSGEKLSKCNRNQTVTSIHQFHQKDFKTYLRVLCAGGAKVNAVNSKNETPLHDAITRADASIVKRSDICLFRKFILHSSRNKTLNLK